MWYSHWTILPRDSSVMEDGCGWDECDERERFDLDVDLVVERRDDNANDNDDWDLEEDEQLLLLFS